MILQRNLAIIVLFLFSIFVGINAFGGKDITSMIFFPLYYVAIWLEMRFSRTFSKFTNKYPVKEKISYKDPFSFYTNAIYETQDIALAVKTYMRLNILRLVEGELIVFYMFVMAIMNDIAGYGVLVSGVVSLLFFLNWWHEWRKLNEKRKEYNV